MFTTKTASHPLHKLVLAAGAVALLGTASLSHANDVVALKHALYGAGYDINNVNAKLDENTRAELTRYQKDQGLEASGTLNEETKKALGMVVVAEAAPESGAPAQAAAKPESEPQPETTEQASEKDDEDEAWSLW